MTDLTGRGSRTEATGDGQLSTSPKHRPSPLTESADEREVNGVESIKGKAGYDFTTGSVEGLR